MPTDVVETADRTVCATHDYDGLAEKIEAVVVACRRDVVHVADELPARAENRTLLQREEVRIVIDPAREPKSVHGNTRIRRVDSHQSTRLAPRRSRSTPRIDANRKMY